MIKDCLNKFFLILIMAFCLQSCIYDYPHYVKGNPDKGENPETVNAMIEISYNLTWENMIHQVEFNTKSRDRGDKPHRFVIEVLKNGENICHDLHYLSSDEFSVGSFTHKLSLKLEPAFYKVAVWYDCQDEGGEFSFDTENLQKVALTNFTTDNVENLQCAFASDILDLSEYASAGKEITISKDLQLMHPGARFEIIATDVQQFITNNKASLNQGDKFNVQISIENSKHVSLNLYSGELGYTNGNILLSGPMRLPFAEYEELKIAEGFLFCNDEEEVDMILEVKNSSLIMVSKSPTFKVPLKRGFITTIYGDFLTNTFDGLFSIDNIWEGEIIMEI